MRTILRLLLTGLILLAVTALPVLAQEAPEAEDPEPVSAFANPTQATIAEGLAAEANEQNMDAINEATAAVGDAQDEVDAAVAAQNAVDEAQKAVEAARDAASANPTPENQATLDQALAALVDATNLLQPRQP